MSLKTNDKMIELTEGEEDPGTLTGLDFPVEGEDAARKARAMKEADSKGKYARGSPIPTRNKDK